MMAPVDFTDCPRVPGRAYNGANGKKVAVRFEGGVWLLKFAPPVASVTSGLSYSNGCVSEHLGSTVYRLLAIPAQETRLGTHVNGSEKLVCACRDFTRPGVRLVDFCSVKNTVLDSETCGTGTELADVLDTIDRQTFVDPVVVRERFWDMFVVDALLGNFDRHNGNWGFLVDDATGAAELAPVFDCGSCLVPQADEEIMRRCLASEDEMNARIYGFPASMLKRDGRKIGYRDFIAARSEPDLVAALARRLPAIRSLDFAALVRDTPYLNEVQRAFYLAYLTARRDRIFEGVASDGTVSPVEESVKGGER